MTRHPHVHKAIWIKELNAFGVYKAPCGKGLESLDYYEIRSLLVKEKMHRDLDVKASPWF